MYIKTYLKNSVKEICLGRLLLHYSPHFVQLVSNVHLFHFIFAS